MFDLDKQAARVGIPPAVLKKRADELYDTDTDGRWLRLSQVFRLATICHTVPYLQFTSSANGHEKKVPSLIGTDLKGFYRQVVFEIENLVEAADSEEGKAAIEKGKAELAELSENPTVAALEKVCKRLDVNRTLHAEIVFLTFHDPDLVKDPEASIATQIRLFMEKYGYSQRTLAEDLNMTQGKIKCWFVSPTSSGYHPPSLSDLQKISALSEQISGEPPVRFYI